MKTHGNTLAPLASAMDRLRASLSTATARDNCVATDVGGENLPASPASPETVLREGQTI